MSGISTTDCWLILLTQFAEQHSLLAIIYPVGLEQLLE